MAWPEADGDRGLALAEGGGGDRGDHHVPGRGSVGQLVDRVEADLGEARSVGLEMVVAEAHGGGDLAERLRTHRTGDVEVGRKGHGAAASRCVVGRIDPG
jgi:hypothetical protein